MMGRQVEAAQLFCKFSLDRHVPSDHLLRRIDQVKMLFAHLKRNLGLRRLRLRGPTGAGVEFLFAANAQNLRRLARSLATSPLMGTTVSA